MLVIVMMLVVAACGDDTPTAGPVAFKATINLSDSPVVGTFSVTTGADVLGCSSGTVVQMANPVWIGNSIMTCDSGPNMGTFTVDHGSEDVYVWNVVESSGDFAGLQGEGSWEFVLTSANAASVVETFTGDIDYTP